MLGCTEARFPHGIREDKPSKKKMIGSGPKKVVR